MRSVSATDRLMRILIWSCLALLAFFWILPLIWVILNSFRTNHEFLLAYAGFSSPLDYLKNIVPRNWTLVSYTQLFTGEGVNGTVDMFSMLGNSGIVAVAQTLIVLVITSLSAFAYERLHFPNGEKIFWALFCLSLFPNAVTIIPLFKICYALNWVNNLNALIWPCCLSVMNILLLRNFMKSIPKELDEAARIDGASSFQTYLLVILPCMKPVLMVVALFAFKHAWNDYLWPCIVMTGSTNLTLTAGLRNLHSMLEGNYWATLQAATVLSIIVPFIIYLFAQNYFIKGISVSSAVKG